MTEALTQEQNKDLQERINQADREVGAILERYRLVMLPVIVTTQFGIMPQNRYFDKAYIEGLNKQAAGTNSQSVPTSAEPLQA